MLNQSVSEPRADRPVIVLTLAIGLLLSACDSQTPPGASPDASDTKPAKQPAEPTAAKPTFEVLDEPAPDDAVKQARKATTELMSTLMQRLTKELMAGGPPAAVKVCAEVAQELAQEQNTDDLHIRRVSLKVRNPADMPDDYERAKLAWMAEQHAAGKLKSEHAEVIRTADGAKQVRYMMPIRIMSMCLQCHGPEDQIDPAVKAVLAEKYPSDAATGYATGDLRGAFSVKVAVE
jgi:hypothetical protein